MRMLVVLTSLIFLLPAVVAAQEEAAPRATIFPQQRQQQFQRVGRAGNV